jgi:broad specificity phosphatase PhoE
VTTPRRLLLLRHGETVWNSERRFTTHTDVPLSDAGMAQAVAIADALATAAIERIYSSPLGRARMTAETIASRQTEPPPIVVDERLVEISAGPFDGHTEGELSAGPMAEAFANWHTDGEPVFPPGTESFDNALARVSSFLDDHAGELGTTLVVTHGSLARLIVSSHLLGGPPPLHRHLWLDNCRLVSIEWRGAVPKMVAFNASRLDT